MGLPLLIIVIFMAAKRFKQKRLSVAIIGLFLSVFMSFLFTNVLKVRKQVTRKPFNCFVLEYYWQIKTGFLE